MTDFYDLAVVNHPIPGETQPYSSRDDYHKINARLRSGYNPNWDPRQPDVGEPGHNGDDIYAPRHTPIYNPFAEPAEVYNAGWLNDLAGRGVELLIPVAGGDLSYRGLHMETVVVAKGDMIPPGHLIGTVGNSGPPKGQPGYVGSPHSHTDIAFYPGGINRAKGMLAQPRIELDIRLFLDRESGGGGGGNITLVTLKGGNRYTTADQINGFTVQPGDVAVCYGNAPIDVALASLRFDKVRISNTDHLNPGIADDLRAAGRVILIGAFAGTPAAREIGDLT